MKTKMSQPAMITSCLVCSTVLLIGGVSWSHLYAQTASDSAVEDIRQAVKDKVQERLDQVVRRPVGLVGRVTQISEDSLTLQASNINYSLSTSTTTEYLRIPGRRTLDRSDIEIDDFALIKGTLDNPDTNQVEADEVQIIPEPEVPQRVLITGTVKTKTNSRLTVDSEGKTYTITINRSSDLYERTETEPQELTINDLAENDTIVITGIQDDEETTSLTGNVIIRLKQAPDESE